jgi:hypothetical protein
MTVDVCVKADSWISNIKWIWRLVQHPGIMFNQWECVYYVGVYKFGCSVNIVWFMMLVNIVRLMVLMCAGSSRVYGLHSCRVSLQL